MKSMKFIFLAIAALQCAKSSGWDMNSKPVFSNYPVSVFIGPVKIPNYYKKNGEIWRDDMGKIVETPRINFAGKYYIGLHSCGADCRYFTLSSLINGNDFNTLNMFWVDNDMHPAKTRDGRYYTVDLIGHPDSLLLIARYYIEATTTQREECREKFFVLNELKMKLSAISETFSGCSNVK